jgi:hypothetical protein
VHDCIRLVSLSSALLALKRKKYQENLLDQTEKQMLNLEELVHHIQFASMQSQVFAALQHGNSVLSALHSETSIEDVEQLMADTREAVEYQNEVAKLMGAELDEADEQDIEKTIRQWEEEVRTRHAQPERTIHTSHMRDSCAVDSNPLWCLALLSDSQDLSAAIDELPTAPAKVPAVVAVTPAVIPATSSTPDPVTTKSKPNKAKEVILS